MLKDMPIDHHGKAIADIVGLCFRKELAMIGPYLDSRFKQTKYLQSLNRVPGKELKASSYMNEGEGIFISSATFWSDLPKLTSKLFKESKSESENVVRILDIPYLHILGRAEHIALVDALSELNDTKVFQLESVRGILNFTWPLTRRAIVKRLLVPYILYALTYFFWALVVSYDRVEKDLHGQQQDSLMHYTDIAATLTVALFSLYFLVLELVQMENEGLSYLLSVWNAIDLAPPFIVFYLIYSTHFIHDDHDEKVIWNL